MKKLTRLFETVRHLRLLQVLARAWLWLSRPAPDMRPAPSLRPDVAAWCKGPAKPISLVAPASARFLNVEGDISGPSAWQDTVKFPLLWLYNLHYFDDLAATDAPARRHWHESLVARWIRENPPIAGIGWQPYPTSLRIVNWIKWQLTQEELNSAVRASLAVQVRHLRKRLEYHILGNHLLANAKALYFAGAFFCGDEAERWSSLGRRLLERQIDEQILSDGAHFELSPMYHLIVLEDLLDIINISTVYGVQLPEGIEAAVSSMLGWSAIMRHPDGQIPFFNDAAFHIAGSPSDIDDYAGALGIAAVLPPADKVLGASGYARLAAGKAVLLADVATVGPDYQPGHAHADTLSFEFSLGHDRLVVNGGTSIYGNGAERQRQRGTPAHSTVTIDGANSSDVWADFRVGRRARIRARSLKQAGAGTTLSATHDGYRHLPGHPLHERVWVLQPANLTITDTVHGTFRHVIESFLHLHPSVSAVQTELGSITLKLASGRMVRIKSTAPLKVIASSWHPEFGRSVSAASLHLHREADLPASITLSLHWDE